MDTVKRYHKIGAKGWLLNVTLDNGEHQASVAIELPMLILKPSMTPGVLSIMLLIQSTHNCLYTRISPPPRYLTPPRHRPRTSQSSCRAG